MMNEIKASSTKPRGFTLMETVIAIGVLAVLLTGFIAVFAPATKGIRRSISVQQADRLTSTLEKELVTFREGQISGITTGFEKAFTWITESDTASTAIFIYQYRGEPGNRTDGTPEPVTDGTEAPGVDYVVQSMARRLDEDILEDDLAAIEGQIFYVKLTQLVSDGDGLVKGTPGTIQSSDGSVAASSDDYDGATIAFVADFYNVPTKAYDYLIGTGFTELFGEAEKPVFSRNMAVRR